MLCLKMPLRRVDVLDILNVLSFGSMSSICSMLLGCLLLVGFTMVCPGSLVECPTGKG